MSKLTAPQRKALSTKVLGMPQKLKKLGPKLPHYGYPGLKSGKLQSLSSMAC